MHKEYPEPVSALLSYGDPRKLKNSKGPYDWPDYVKELGLSLDDIPHLIRMLHDPAVQHTGPDNSSMWADLHAWRAIGQLGAADGIPDLIRCLDYEDEHAISDWVMEEIPRVLAKIGKATIEPLSEYLNNKTKGVWSLTAAVESLSYIAAQHPEFRNLCIVAIDRRLEYYETNDVLLNGFLVAELVDMNAVGSLDLIRKAFQTNAVDIDVAGDFEDVEIAFGVRKVRSTPKPQSGHCGMVGCHEDHHHEDRWTNGLPQAAHVPKIGRNDSCPCGSGKKYKKCCLG